MKVSHLLKIWYKPRSTAAIFSQQQKRTTLFLFIGVLGFFYLIEMIFFLFLIGLTPVRLFSFAGLKWGLIFTILFGAAIYTLTTSIALFTWMMAKSLGGTANIPQTRSAVLLALFALLPLGVSFSFFALAVQKPETLFPSFWMFSCLGLLVYGLAVFTKTVSGVHQINFWRSLISLFAGTVVGSLLVVFLYKIITPLWG